MKWTEHQQFEKDYWGDCTNTYDEETKQLVYASRMGWNPNRQNPSLHVGGLSVVDFGGGPVSLLLKCKDFETAWIVDPCSYPAWVEARYAAHGIVYRQQKAEDFRRQYGHVFHECWIYNVLQHVEDPEAVIRSAQQAARIIRLFEWVEEPTSLGHPHELHVADLNNWLNGRGTTEQLQESGCSGLAYYGIFSCV